MTTIKTTGLTTDSNYTIKDVTQSPIKKTISVFFLLFRISILAGLFSIVVYAFAIVLNAPQLVISNTDTQIILQASDGNLSLFILKYIFPIVMIALMLVFLFINFVIWLGEKIIVKAKELDTESDKAWATYFKSNHTFLTMPDEIKTMLTVRETIKNKYSLRWLCLWGMYAGAILIPPTFFMGFNNGPFGYDISGVGASSIIFILSLFAYWFYGKPDYVSKEVDRLIKRDTKIKARLEKKGLL